MHQITHLIALTIDGIDENGTIAPTRFIGPTEVPIGGLVSKGPNGTTTLQTIIQNGVTIIIIIAITLSLFFLIWGGIQWIMSQGDKHKLDQAKARITYSLIGLLVIFFAFFIVRLVGSLFGIDVLCVTSACKI